MDILELTMREMRSEGKSYREIASELKVPYASVQRLFYSKSQYDRLCLLDECRAPFSTNRINKIYCSSDCSQLGGRPSKEPLVDDVCCLPGCANSVKTPKGVPRFCSRNCQKRDHKRKQAGGFYCRILGIGPKCIACDECCVIDWHHTDLKPSKITKHKGSVMTKSDKEGPKVLLCPTHHMMIHRGYAKIENGLFVDLRPMLKKELLTKHPDFRQPSYQAAHPSPDLIR
jgi:hypothetical protein